MTHRLLAPVIAVTLSVLAASSIRVSAWGNEGHRAVARVALSVSPGLSAKVQSLMNADLVSVATCADEVRELEQGKITALTVTCAAIFPKPPTGTANGHFIDLDVHKPSMNDAAIDAFCKTKKICAVERILFFQKQLRTLAPKKDNASVLARRQALAFITHFVGDIHQPLHAAERDNDFGGGGVNVQFSHQTTVLHSVWDSGVMRNVTSSDSLFVNGLATEIAAAKTEKVPADVSHWVHQWARDSQALAIAHAYRDIAGTTVVEIPRKAAPPFPLLSARYEAIALADIKSQIAKAGFRLATLLESALP